MGLEVFVFPSFSPLYLSSLPLALSCVSIESPKLTVTVEQVLTSFLTSITLLFSSLSGTTKLILALVNIAVLLAAKDHVGGHWRSKFKVPLPKTGDYNDAIGATQEVLGNMIYLVGGWVVLGALGLVL